MSLKHKTGRDRLLAEADKLSAASGEQHNHKVNLHFVLISTEHPVLAEIHLCLLSIRKLLDGIIVPRGSFRFRNIMGFSDPLNKGVDRSSCYLREIRVMLLQPIFYLCRTTVLIIAHRLTTLQNCDQIVELADGGIKRIGTYQEIVGEDNMANSPVQLSTKKTANC